MFLTRFPIIVSTFSTVFSLSTGIFRYVLPSLSSFLTMVDTSFLVASGSLNVFARPEIKLIPF